MGELGNKYKGVFLVFLGLFLGFFCCLKLLDSEMAYYGNIAIGRKEMFLFNDAVNTFYLRLYGVGHMVKDHSDSERGNLLPPHGLLFSIDSKGSFICTIPQTG